MQIFHEAYQFYLRLSNWWLEGTFGASPDGLKRKTIERYLMPSCDLVETGSYHGKTARYFGRLGYRVVSLEPSAELLRIARANTAKLRNVSILYGSSEALLSTVLANASSNRIVFWLDGHYSGPGTYQGQSDCPIESELESIAAAMHGFSYIRILIDDFRLFGIEKGYPPKDYLVDWARKYGFDWDVKNDIFILSSNFPS